MEELLFRNDIMGTDIHAFLEHRDNRGSFSGRSDDPAFFFAKFALARDYLLFDALAGVRSRQFSSDDRGFAPLHEPRGIPDDLSLDVAWEYYDLIIEDGYPDPRFWPAPGCISMEEAETRPRVDRHFISQTMFVGTSPPRSWSLVVKRNWFAASWLYLGEVTASLQHHYVSLGNLSWESRVLLASLSNIEEHLGHERARLVFWFSS